MEELDRSLRTLDSRKLAWARLPIGTKIRYLEAVRENTHAAGPQWVRSASAAKHIPAGSPLAGEEWLAGPYALLYCINRYIKTLRDVLANRTPSLPRDAVRESSAEGTVVRVFPTTAYDRLLYAGITADVYVEPGITPERLVEGLASFYRLPEPAGEVALVLGAGNIASIAPLDALYKLFAEGAVCLVKLNPVNDYLGPIFQDIFEPFVTAGYLRFAYGGAGVGDYLSRHTLVKSIHLTGSKDTYEAVRAAIAPLGKRLTSELGNVSPTIVVPGNWRERDFIFQAEHIVTQKQHNAGFNCIASQVLILPRDWEGTAKLLQEISKLLRSRTPRYPYYPGANQRTQALVGMRENVSSFFRADGSNAADPMFHSEAFGAAFAYVDLPGNPPAYLRSAVQFANERLAGNLGANLVVDPRTQRTIRSEISQAIADLHYGCVGVNAWTGVGFFLAETPWGAARDSGHGDGARSVVHNAYFMEGTAKSVIRAPFRPFVKPPWFVTNRAAARVGKLLCDFEARPSPMRACKVAFAALRG
ncbi:MAG: aldehyde dehydrogenase family protein [Candidatus Eremiobacteraeota bacterium]|nr:aldehyde dehydrogenase family protein [Candidatus Eremiobacteraeota bacterium]